MTADILTTACALLARRRATSDLEAVAALAGLIAEVERLRVIVDKRRLVWVRDEMPAGWHLCRPDQLPRDEALYTAFDRTHYAYAHDDTPRGRHVRDPAERLALLVEWAQADGYEPDPWPGEATP